MGSRTANVLLAAAAVALLGVGVASGIWWESQRTAVETRELRAEVERLRAERARTAELAARLDSIEARYARLRRLMTGELASSERDVGLPSPPQTVEPAGDERTEEAGWSWPLSRRGFVTRTFGSGGSPGHPGVDIAVPTGSYVRAARAGIVEGAGRDSIYGLKVRVRHAAGLESLYGHASWLFVAEGDSVEEGEVVALSGSTGRSTAPHLHFAILRDGTPVDPMPVLAGAFEREDGADGPRSEN